MADMGELAWGMKSPMTNAGSLGGLRTVVASGDGGCVGVLTRLSSAWHHQESWATVPILLHSCDGGLG